MKLSSLLAKFSAAISVVTLALAVLFTGYAATFLAISAVAFVGLIAARDYAPRPRRWQPAVSARRHNGSHDAHRLRLAA